MGDLTDKELAGLTKYVASYANGGACLIVDGAISKAIDRAFTEITRRRTSDAILTAVCAELVGALRDSTDFLQSYFGPIVNDELDAWSDADAFDVARQNKTALAKAAPFVSMK